MSGRRLVVVLAGLLGIPGCATTRPQDPVSATRRYLELAAEQRIDAAYALLGEPFRRRCDRACFARLLSTQHDEARRAANDLHSGGTPRLERTIEFTLPDGTTLHLDQPSLPEEASRPAAAKRDADLASDSGDYQFSQNPLDFYPQSTPEETVRSFVRAVNAGRYQALLRFVPKTLADQLTADQLRQRFEGPARAGLMAQLTALQKHWNEPFQIDGTTARLPTGDGQEVRLVLEQGRWRMAQLQ